MPGPDRNNKIKKCDIEKAKLDRAGKHKTLCVPQSGVVCLYKILKKVFNDARYTKNFSNLQYAAELAGFKRVPTTIYPTYDKAKENCEKIISETIDDDIYKEGCYCVPYDGTEKTNCVFFKKSNGTIKNEYEETLIENESNGWKTSISAGYNNSATIEACKKDIATLKNKKSVEIKNEDTKPCVNNGSEANPGMLGTSLFKYMFF